MAFQTEGIGTPFLSGSPTLPQQTRAVSPQKMVRPPVTPNEGNRVTPLKPSTLQLGDPDLPLPEGELPFNPRLAIPLPSQTVHRLQQTLQRLEDAAQRLQNAARSRRSTTRARRYRDKGIGGGALERLFKEMKKLESQLDKLDPGDPRSQFQLIQIQQRMQRIVQMIALIVEIRKALHDTSMAIIRNIR